MPSPRDSTFFLPHPALKRWAIIFGPASRDWIIVVPTQIFTKQIAVTPRQNPNWQLTTDS